MRKSKTIERTIIALAVGLLLYVGAMYVYIGTYVLPIAPYWVTQLPPNPPKPRIKQGKFDFKLEYEVSGEKKVIKDTLVCYFAGFVVNGIGAGKTVEWKAYFENEQKNELFTERLEQVGTYSKKNKTEFNHVVLFNSGIYKILLRLEEPRYFLDKDKYYNYERSTMPYIGVYSALVGGMLGAESQEVIDAHGFKVLSWQCDEPVENTFW